MDLLIDHLIGPIPPYGSMSPRRIGRNRPVTKRDRLPAPNLLERSEDRILSWWERAWVSNPGTVDRFTAEAKASLPVPGGREDLGAIFMGVQARRFAIRADQQVAEWAPA